MGKYSDKLKDPRWQKKRLEILERDSFTCRMCKDKETELHIHHLKYGYDNPWENDNEDLITCCKVCHKIIQIAEKDDNFNNLSEIIKNDIFYIALGYDALNKKTFILYVINNDSLLHIMQCGDVSIYKVLDLLMKSYYFLTNKNI